MTDWLEEKAEGGPDVVTTTQSEWTVWRLESLAKVPADELTPEGEFPEFGDFIEVRKPGTDRGVQYLEVSQDLAAWLLENDAEPGMTFRVKAVEKQGGSWTVDAEVVEDPESLPDE